MASVTTICCPAGGSSSSVIVPTPVASAIVAFTAPDNTRENDSSLSSVVSPSAGTLSMRFSSPGANDSCPLEAMKSEPAAAVPATVAYDTVTDCVELADKLIVKVASVLPDWPSPTGTSLTITRPLVKSRR